jgi:CarD family transcriptional regulator
MKLQPDVPKPRAITMLDAKRALRTSNFPPDECTSILPAEKIEPVVNWGFAKGKLSMEFKKGLTVVYPHHGAATILEVAKKEFRGEKKLYLKLKVEAGNLIIWVPAETAESEVGVRDVIDAKGVKKVEAKLKEEFIEEPTNWSRRFKANQEKLASGDVMKVSEIVRDLWRRQQDRGLSAGEKRMLAKAMQILVSELALALKTDDPGAEAHILKVLAKGAR